MPFEFEVADDFRAEQAVDVAGGGTFEPGPKFFGDDAATDQCAPFEHEHLAASAREIRGRDEPVMPCPDDDGVVFGIHELTGGNGANRVESQRRKCILSVLSALQVNPAKRTQILAVPR